MRILNRSLSELAGEHSLRCDFAYHKYQYEHHGETYSFGELFSVCPKVSVASDTLCDDFKYCEIGDTTKDGEVNPVCLNFEDRDIVDESYYKKISKGDIMSVEENDILISKVRPNLGKFILISADNCDVYFTKAFISVRAKEMPKILFYGLRSLFFNNVVAVARQGKGYPTLNERDLANLKFEKSKIDALRAKQDNMMSRINSLEQNISDLKRRLVPTQRIVDDIFADELKINREEFQRLKAIKSYMADFDMFSNNQDLRFSAKYHRAAGEYLLSELSRVSDKKVKHFLAEPIVLGASVSPKDFDENGQAYYVSMASIKTLEIVLDDTQLLSDEYFESNRAKALRQGDIIIARSGVAIGKAALVKDEFEGIFADFTMRIRLSNYDPLFAYYYFRSQYFQYLIEIYKKGVQNQNIFPRVIQEFPIPDFSLDTQACIVADINSRIKEQSLLETQISEKREQIYALIRDAVFS